MKSGRLSTSCQNKGSSLIESVIAMGVLSVAIPLVFGALAESGKSGISAEAETRSSWVVPTCIQEIRASRDGRPVYFTPTTVGQAIPPSGDVWAIGFSSDGKTVGKVSKALYDKGTKEINSQAIAYIASLSAVPPTSTPAGVTPLMTVKILLEYPATLPATKRQKLEFYTRVP